MPYFGSILPWLYFSLIHTDLVTFFFFSSKTFLGNFFRNRGRVKNHAEMRGSVFLYFVIVSPRSFLNRLKLLVVSSFHLAIRFIKTLPAKTLLFLLSDDDHPQPGGLRWVLSRGAYPSSAFHPSRRASFHGTFGLYGRFRF